MSKKKPRKLNGTKTTIIFNVILYFIVSVVSTIHSISLFNLFNPFWLAVIIASAFEFGQVVSLLTLTLMKLKSKFKTRLLFFSLTTVQVIGNLFSTVNYYTKNILNRDVVSDIDTLVVYLSRIYQDATGFGITETLVVVINGSLPIIALLFIENIIEHISGKKNKSIVEEKEETTSDDVINDLFSTNEALEDIVEDKKEETTVDHKSNGETEEVPEIVIKPPENEVVDEKKNEGVVEEIIDEKVEEKEEKDLENEVVEEVSEINNESTDNNDNTQKADEKEIIRDVEEKKSKKVKVKGKVRMKVVEGKDKYTFKDIDRTNLPTF